MAQRDTVSSGQCSVLTFVWPDDEDDQPEGDGGKNRSTVAVHLLDESSTQDRLQRQPTAQPSPSWSSPSYVQM